MSKRKSSGSRYWASQIVAAAFFVVLCLGGGVFILASDSGEKGKGVMLILAGLLFIGALIWLIRQMTSTTREQRAIYAWVIMQRYPNRRRRGMAQSVGNDFETMGVAALARDGKLTRDQILDIQVLRPDIPYPATLPPAHQQPSAGS